MSSVFIYIYPISLNYFRIFSREIQAIIRPHTNSHTILRFTTKRHIKRKKDILLLKTLSRSRRARRRWSPLLNILQHKNLYFTSFNTLCKLLSGILDISLYEWVRMVGQSPKTPCFISFRVLFAVFCRPFGLLIFLSVTASNFGTFICFSSVDTLLW